MNEELEAELYEEDFAAAEFADFEDEDELDDGFDYAYEYDDYGFEYDADPSPYDGNYSEE